MSELTTDLQAQFATDIMIHTRFRSFILAGVLLLIVTGFGINVVLHEELFYLIGDKGLYVFMGFGLLILLAVRSFIIALLLPKTFKKIGKVPLFTRYGNTLLEITVPSISIIILVLNFNAYSSLVAPIVAIYYLFILLSTLEMDLKISIFAGLVGAVQYYLIASYVIDHYEPVQGIPVLGEKVFYFGKSLIMVLAGLVAGLVGEQIKKRIFKFYESQKERSQLQKLFGQQVSEAIAHEFIDNNYEVVSRKRNACIMFLDIRDFTPMTEKMNPEEIIKYQNQIFPFMIGLIHDHHGIINQLMGDGFMATFGAPVSAGNDCLNAVSASMAILSRLDEINADGSIPKTRIGMGIHYGEVVTGMVGSEIRNQYSITGQPVIIASRLEQLNKRFHSTLLISEAVYPYLNSEQDWFKSIGPVTVKGLIQPIELYQFGQ